MGNAQRNKGLRSEREFSKLINGERIPLSGAAGGSFKGDVKGMGLLFECKVRKDGFKQIYGWLEDVDALALKANRREWLVVVPLSKFKEIAGIAVACTGCGEVYLKEVLFDNQCIDCANVAYDK